MSQLAVETRPYDFTHTYRCGHAELIHAINEIDELAYRNGVHEQKCFMCSTTEGALAAVQAEDWERAKHHMWNWAQAIFGQDQDWTPALAEALRATLANVPPAD